MDPRRPAPRVLNPQDVAMVSSCWRMLGYAIGAFLLCSIGAPDP